MAIDNPLHHPRANLAVAHLVEVRSDHPLMPAARPGTGTGYALAHTTLHEDHHTAGLSKGRRSRRHPPDTARAG